MLIGICKAIPTGSGIIVSLKCDTMMLSSTDGGDIWLENHAYTLKEHYIM